MLLTDGELDGRRVADPVVVRLGGGAEWLFSVVKDVGGVDYAVAAHDENRACDARLALHLWRHTR